MEFYSLGDDALGTDDSNVQYYVLLEISVSTSVQENKKAPAYIRVGLLMTGFVFSPIINMVRSRNINNSIVSPIANIVRSRNINKNIDSPIVNVVRSRNINKNIDTRS